MAISGTVLTAYSSAVRPLRAEPRFGAVEPVPVPLRQTSARPAPQRERVLEGEVVEPAFRAGNTTETVFSRAFIEGAFDYRASGHVFAEVRPGRQAVASYREIATVDVQFNDAQNRLVDFFI